jgi:hypothetical protein
MKSLKPMAFILALFVGSAAGASTASQGITNTIHFLSSGIVLVYTSGSRPGIPACGAGQVGHFALDSTTAGGRSQLAGLLAADAAKRPVVIVGSGGCEVYGDTETLNYFYIAD